MLIRPDVEQAFERAVREAKERHHDEVTAMHLLHALLLQPDLAGMLRKAGGDVSSLREATARRLERLEAFELGVGDELERLVAPFGGRLLGCCREGDHLVGVG